MKPLMKTTWWAVRVVVKYLLATIFVLAIFSLLAKVPVLAMTVAILMAVIVGITALCLAGLFIWSCFMSLREYYLTAKKVEALKEASKKEEQR